MAHQGWQELSILIKRLSKIGWFRGTKIKQLPYRKESTTPKNRRVIHLKYSSFELPDNIKWG